MKKTFTKIGLLAITAVAAAFSPAFAGLDAAMTKFTISNTYVGVTSSDLIKGTMQNTGTDAITSYTISYSINGATPISQTFTKSVAAGATSNFIMSKKLTRSAVGTYNVVATVTANGLTSDDNPANDAQTAVVYYFDKATAPKKNMVVEEGTGTWCGWCVRGHVYMDSIAAAEPDNTVLIAVHNSDPMTLTAYDAAMGNIISGYPSAVFNRSLVGDPQDVFTQYGKNSSSYGLADLTFNTSYDPATRIITGDVTANFGLPATGDFRFAMVITEDNVKGTASGYDQHNYYSYQSQNMALSGAGHNWNTEPQVVPASRMVYNFVARQLIGGFTGAAGSLPAVIDANTPYSYTLTSNALPVGVKIQNIKVHILLIDAGNNIIYNGRTQPANTVATAIADAKPVIENLTAYPNPTQNELTVSFGLDKAQKVNVTVLNGLGQVVKTQVAENITSGKNEVKVNTADLAKGIYFVEISTSEGVASHKFVKID